MNGESNNNKNEHLYFADSEFISPTIHLNINGK